jgi:hypothetical protein
MLDAHILSGLIAWYPLVSGLTLPVSGNNLSTDAQDHSETEVCKLEIKTIRKGGDTKVLVIANSDRSLAAIKLTAKLCLAEFCSIDANINAETIVSLETSGFFTLVKSTQDIELLLEQRDNADIPKFRVTIYEPKKHAVSKKYLGVNASEIRDFNSSYEGGHESFHVDFQGAETFSSTITSNWCVHDIACAAKKRWEEKSGRAMASSCSVALYFMRSGPKGEEAYLLSRRGTGYLKMPGGLGPRLRVVVHERGQ